MKKKNRNAIISLITVILLTFITSCSKANGVLPDLEITDGGLISGIPCSAPCFWDILPGITTESEAIEILSTLGSINNCEKWEKVENGADRGLRCKNVGLTFDENDYVNQLSFSPDIPITVDELFAKYGELRIPVKTATDSD